MSFWFHIEVDPDGPRPEANASEADERTPDYSGERSRVWSGLPLILLGRQGCIAGYLFRREAPCGRILELDDETARQVIASRGAALLAAYWGGYVAMIEGGDGRIDIVRDPSGMLPCYVRRDGRALRLASDMTALATPGQAKVDFGVVAKMLASVDALGRKTGIVGIEELLPGERLIVTAAGSRVDIAWSPWDHVPRRFPRSFSENAEALRATVKQSVGAWTTCFDSILLGASGGVDSSVVAAAAIPRTPGLRLLTLVEPGTEGDERRYARALADKLGSPLTAAHFDLGAVDVTRPVLPHLPVPLALPLMQAIEAIHREEQLAKPVDAFFSGNGGDNVFCNMHSAAPFADRLIAKGPGPGAWRTALDLADLTGSTMTEVLRHGWRRFRSRREPHPIRLDLMGLGPNAVAAAATKDDRHPWLVAPRGALPGQKAYVAMQARGQKSIELYPRRTHAPQISPLMSQPILEFCLATPSWHAVSGGRDRAVARAAFAEDLPPLVVNRRTKGSPQGFLRRIFDAQLPAAIALLNDGRLVDAGIVDPAFLAGAGQAAWRDDGRDNRILAFAAAETWARWWEEGAT